MTETTNSTVFSDAVMNTPFGALAVKKCGASVISPLNSFGVIVKPMVTTNKVSNNPMLRERMANEPVVVVRGHGWLDGERFVWEGTGAEFNEVWIGD